MRRAPGPSTIDGSTSPLTKTRNCPSEQFLNGLILEIVIANTALACRPAAELDGSWTKQRANPSRQSAIRADNLFNLHTCEGSGATPATQRRVLR
jgi:hypothetical protein